MMKVTKWRLVTILEVDEEGITKIKHLEPVMLQPDEDEEEEDEGE